MNYMRQMNKVFWAAFIGLIFSLMGISGYVEATDDQRIEDPEQCLDRVITYGDIIEKSTQTKYSTDGGVTWTEFDTLTDWPDAGSLTDDGRFRGPAEHGSDLEGEDQWYRQYIYVVVGQYEKSSELVRVACPMPPTPLPTTGPFFDEEFVCGDTTVVQNRVVLNFNWVLEEDGYTWELIESSTNETATRDLTAEEIASLNCPPAYIPAPTTTVLVTVIEEPGFAPEVTTTTEIPTTVPSTPAPLLPATGNDDPQWVAIIGFIAVVLGIGLAFAARRDKNIWLPWRRD